MHASLRGLLFNLVALFMIVGAVTSLPVCDAAAYAVSFDESTPAATIDVANPSLGDLDPGYHGLEAASTGFGTCRECAPADPTQHGPDSLQAPTPVERFAVLERHRTLTLLDGSAPEFSHPPASQSLWLIPASPPPQAHSL